MSSVSEWLILLKLSFPINFRNTVKNISHSFYSFNLKVGQGLKIYIFLLLTILTIPIDPDAHHWAMIYAIA